VLKQRRRFADAVAGMPSRTRLLFAGGTLLFAVLLGVPGAAGQDPGLELRADPEIAPFGEQIYLEGHVPPGTRGNVQVLASPWPYQDEHVVRESPIGSNNDFFLYVRQALNTRYRLRVPEIAGSEPQAEMTSSEVPVYSTARLVYKHKEHRGPGEHLVTFRFDYQLPEDFVYPLASRRAFWYIRKKGAKRWYLKARSRTSAKGRRVIARVTFRRPLTTRRHLRYQTTVCIEVEPGTDIGLGRRNPPCPKRPAPPKVFHRAAGAELGFAATSWLDPADELIRAD
jgi:hypothetical protein